MDTELKKLVATSRAQVVVETDASARATMEATLKRADANVLHWGRRVSTCVSGGGRGTASFGMLLQLRSLREKAAVIERNLNSLEMRVNFLAQVTAAATPPRSRARMCGQSWQCLMPLLCTSVGGESGCCLRCGGCSKQGVRWWHDGFPR